MSAERLIEQQLIHAKTIELTKDYLSEDLSFIARPLGAIGRTLQSLSTFTGINFFLIRINLRLIML